MDGFGLVGQVADGRYRVEGFSREEPSWVVYRARDAAGAAVALKCLKVIDAGYVGRVQRRLADEVPAQLRLAERALGLCPMLASGLARTSSAQQVLFVAYPWLDGVTLEEDLRQRRIDGRGPRTWGEVRAIFAPAAEALAHAHAASLLHLDLQPLTLFLEGGARLRVTDFGVARLLEHEASGDEVQTRAGASSPHYTAPERFDARFGPLGPWTDVYCLALAMLEVAHGERVRKGKGYAEVALEVLERKRVPTPRALGMDVPDSLEDFFASALALEARARPRDAADLWSRFEGVLAVPTSPHAIDSGPNTRPRVAEGSETRAFTPSAMPPPVRAFLGTDPSIDDDRTVMAPPPEERDSSPTIATAYSPPGLPSAPIVRPPAPPVQFAQGQVQESSVIEIEPDPSEVAERTLLLADRDRAPARAAAPPAWLPPAPPPPPPPAPAAPIMRPAHAPQPYAPQAYAPQPYAPQAYAPQMQAPQMMPPPASAAIALPPASNSTRTLLWVALSLLALALIGGAAALFLVMRAR